MSAASASWDLKGRSALNAIQPQQQQRILRSQLWLQVVGKPLMWVIERGIDLERVGCVYGRGDVVLPDLFICLVARLLQILPKPELVLAMVRQEEHKYLRILGAVVVRLIGNQTMSNVTMEICFEDYRNIRVRGSDGNVSVEPLDKLCESLFFGSDQPDEPLEPGSENANLGGWLGLHLSSGIYRAATTSR
ncbi:Hypothetical protein, putative [Bodo saltans]|uniref:Pre-mRNA-splicing factor 38 n=1 Tax=Bodo saltans TaxID=75058 RepID=A0A0S4KHF4_BODSA|nr:Hypothetical protein, putative [Bodo saltans]|eukprot:CUI12707.1 Hypothetical protein, putative [Bodo saltans]